MKKFSSFAVGSFLLFICSGVYSGALELHSALFDHMQWFTSVPESGGLIVIGSVLIFGASILRRRRAAQRSR